MELEPSTGIKDLDIGFDIKHRVVILKNFVCRFTVSNDVSYTYVVESDVTEKRNKMVVIGGL